MKLAENIVRINGYKNGKRTHVDFEVSTKEKEVSWGKGHIIPLFKDCYATETGFELGLDGVTSINMYNWISDERMITKVD